MTEAENSSNQAPQPLPQVQSLDEVQPDQNPNAYNAASIQILEGLEAVQQQLSGMISTIQREVPQKSR